MMNLAFKMMQKTQEAQYLYKTMPKLIAFFKAKFKLIFYTRNSSSTLRKKQNKTSIVLNIVPGKDNFYHSYNQPVLPPITQRSHDTFVLSGYFCILCQR